MPYLHVYRAPSGQWSGIVYQDGEEIARIAGCETSDDVLNAAMGQWPDVEPADLDCLNDEGEPLGPPPFVTRTCDATPSEDWDLGMIQTQIELSKNPTLRCQLSKRGF